MAAPVPTQYAGNDWVVGNLTPSGGAIAVPVPTVAANDLLLYILAGWDDSDFTSANFTTKFLTTFNDLDLACMVRKCTGSEGATLSVTVSNTTVAQYLRLHIPAAQWSQDLAKVYSATSATGTSANANPPNNAPGVGTMDFYCIATAVHLFEDAFTGWPANYTAADKRNQIASSDNGRSTAAAGRTATVASEDPGTFTSANEDWVANTILIEPAAAAGGATYHGWVNGRGGWF